jgi:hypothetical protein
MAAFAGVPGRRENPRLWARFMFINAAGAQNPLMDREEIGAPDGIGFSA